MPKSNPVHCWLDQICDCNTDMFHVAWDPCAKIGKTPADGAAVVGDVQSGRVGLRCADPAMLHCWQEPHRDTEAEQ